MCHANIMTAQAPVASVCPRTLHKTSPGPENCRTVPLCNPSECGVEKYDLGVGPVRTLSRNKPSEKSGMNRTGNIGDRIR